MAERYARPSEDAIRDITHALDSDPLFAESPTASLVTSIYEKRLDGLFTNCHACQHCFARLSLSTWPRVDQLAI